MGNAARRECFVDRHNFESVVRFDLPGDLTAEQWKRAVEYFGGRCAYCREPGRKITLDHFVPRILGGGTTVLNVIPACKQCNGRKSGRLLDACSFIPDHNKQKVYAYLGSLGLSAAAASVDASA